VKVFFAASRFVGKQEAEVLGVAYDKFIVVEFSFPSPAYMSSVKVMKRYILYLPCLNSLYLSLFSLSPKIGPRSQGLSVGKLVASSGGSVWVAMANDKTLDRISEMRRGLN